MEGPALSWFNGLSPDLTWRTIKKLFSDIPQHATRPSQEIENFLCQVQEKGQLLSNPDHKIMFRFIHGLPDKLAFYVRSSQLKTMYDALSFAKQGETYKYRIHEQCAAIGKRADISHSDDISEMKSQIYDLTQMMHNMSSRQGCQPAKFDNTLCFNCNAPGHVKKSCNWNGSGDAIPDISYQLCQQNGHGATQCTRYKPKHMNEHVRNRVVCQICSSPNHVASECFRYTQQGNPNFRGAPGTTARESIKCRLSGTCTVSS